MDTNRFVLAGHSAGGQLALWAAGRNRLARDSELYRPEPALPQVAIGLAAIADLAIGMKFFLEDNGDNGDKSNFIILTGPHASISNDDFPRQF